MSTVENLREIIDSQKKVLKQLEAEFQLIENSDITQENIKLKGELEKIQDDYKIASNTLLDIKQKNSNLKNALYEQIYNEKISILNWATSKINVYFKSEVQGEENKLRRLENKARTKIIQMTEILKNNNIETSDEIYTKLYELENLVNEKVTTEKIKIQNMNFSFSRDELDELDNLKKEQITDEQINLITKKNNIERFVGLNLFNIIGIFLIIMGAITAARYSYLHLPDILKGLIIFILGTVMLVAGELINRKKTSIFSLGITAGGVGVLYVAVSTSYFLLGINTILSSFITYGVFYKLELSEFNGVLAIFFAITYIYLGRFIEKKSISCDGKTKALFYMVGLAFVVLIIPFQFGIKWLSLGWLAEGVILTTYGILNNEKIYKRIGFIINSICLAAFVLVDILFYSGDRGLFHFKYLAITIGALIILGAYIRKKMLYTKFEKIYKYGVIINIWLYMMYATGKLSADIVLYTNYSKMYAENYLYGALAIVLTFALAYIVPRIKILYDTGMKIISISLYVISILMLLRHNSDSGSVNQINGAGVTINIIATIVIITVSLLSIFAVRDLMHLIIKEKKISIEWYPITISGYFIIILTQNLVIQYELSFLSSAISIIYVLIALSCIIFGFTKRYLLIRKFGLGLAILSVIKLILIDLASLTKGDKVISYFALGVTLVGISYVYQYFSKRLELKEERGIDENK